MKSKKQQEKLAQRVRDFMRGPQGLDRSKSLQWGGDGAGYHKPGSNKK